MSTYYRLESSETKELQSRNASIRTSCKAFSWQLVINGGWSSSWCHPHAAGPGSIRKQTDETIGSKSVSNTPPWALNQFITYKLSWYSSLFWLVIFLLVILLTCISNAIPFPTFPSTSLLSPLPSASMRVFSHLPTSPASVA